MAGLEVGLPQSVLDRDGLSYVALGHIHKHQSIGLDGGLPIVYSGSIERVDFGEEGQPKGYCLAEIALAKEWAMPVRYELPM